MRRVLLLMALGACSEQSPASPSVDPPPDGTRGCDGPDDCSFGESCEEGSCRTVVPDPVLEPGCRDDADCPGELCALSTGLCVPAASTPDPEYVPPPECGDGATRPCGSKLGRCEYGVQTCDAGVWGACVGGIGPAASEDACNGVDDLCDGELDAAESDVDGDGQRPCEGDCDDLDARRFQGNPELCDGVDNNCDSGIDEGTDALCDDSNPCTVGDACTGGRCVPGNDTCDCSVNTTLCDNLEAAENNRCNGRLVCNGTTCVIEPGSEITCPSSTCRSGACVPATGLCTFTDHDGRSCNDNRFCTVNDTCALGACGGTARDCTDPQTQCAGTCNEQLDRCDPDPLCNCDPVDRDFDGQSECQGDCDDTNGAVHTGAGERCNGIDDNCDGRIDETFDVDQDGWSVCATRPQDVDCRDDIAAINPGAAEDCGPSGTGNGVDEDCDGYIDELCAPCSNADPDNDGFSECQGDCATNVASDFPGAPEQCDGRDNDCNATTIENCEVSDPCNFASGADVCADELLCVCILNNNGACTGNYRCTSLCNSSATGGIGDGCASDEICGLDMLNSAAVHGCTVDSGLAASNTRGGGAACDRNSQCRSNTCLRLFTGQGGEYCYDLCASDAYCTSGICSVQVSSSDADAICWPNRGIGAGVTGTACTQNNQCDHLYCATDGAARYCSEPCCRDSDCPSGFTCSLLGPQVYNNYVLPVAGMPCGAGCPSDMVCYTQDDLCAYRMSETQALCLRDVAGQGGRPAGAACSSSAECRSNFCERTLGVCVEPCCNDASCPTGLTCESQIVEAGGDFVTTARVCVNLSTDTPLLRR